VVETNVMGEVSTNAYHYVTNTVTATWTNSAVSAVSTNLTDVNYTDANILPKDQYILVGDRVVISWTGAAFFDIDLAK
jgi:hypothetical protein